MKLNKKINSILSHASLLLLLIVLFGIFLRLIFFSGMGISDDLAYSKAAHDIMQGNGIDPNSTLTLSTRLGLIYPTIFFYKLFGVNDFSSILFPLLTSIASIILIFYFGKLLFNEKIGFIAAFLLSFFPLDVVYATKLNSDLPSAFFMALGVYLFLYSEKIGKLKINYILSGIFIGIGYMIRESALLIALFFIVYILPKKKIKKEYFLVPVGVVIIFIAESFIFFSLTGDPLFRSNASQGYLEEASIAHNYFGRLDFPTGLFHYPWLFLTNNLLSFFYVLVFIAVIYLLYCKRKETSKMMFWLIPLLVYLSFGSASLIRYIPFRAVDRYTSIFTIPAIIILAVFLAEKRGIIRRWVMPFAITLLLISSITVVYFREDRNLLENLRQLYPIIQNLDKTVYIDSRSLLALGYISKYNDNTNIENYPDDLSNIKNSYVAINKEMVRNLMEANKNTIFPKEIGNPPKAWQIIKKIGNNKEDKIALYFVQ